MAWMSVNAFKRRFGFGKKSEKPKDPKEKEPVLYETFHEVKRGEAELVFQAKKRYVKLFTRPLGAEFPISREEAAGIVNSMAAHLGMTFAAGGNGRIKKNATGLKEYVKLKDSFQITVVLNGLSDGKAVIFWSGDKLPHLKEAEVQKLGDALLTYAKEVPGA